MRTIFVYINTIHQPWPWLRQTPAGDGVWQNTQFSFNESMQPGEWMVVYDEPKSGTSTFIPKERRVLYITEPPEVKSYHRSYLKQFGVIVSPIHIHNFSGYFIKRHSALPWHFGVDMSSLGKVDKPSMNWSELKSDKAKTRLISVICSSRDVTSYQRLRLDFVRSLIDVFGSDIDFFGRGFNEVKDKATAISPYKYHIVLENNDIDDFWTEKLADAWLGDSFPLYSGSKNLYRYFSTGSFHAIDVRDITGSILSIKNLIQSNIWEQRRDTIRESRRRVMEQYNLFPEVSKLVNSFVLNDIQEPALATPAPLYQSRQFILERIGARLA